ncbi:Bro-N domain-containing protein [Ectopseudomonas khazarica]|uniref:BRO-N domain-containing protein n=1 Tax=Ectopseudomonas khazarica TaxID=2502979 RepID=UPI00384D087A
MIARNEEAPSAATLEASDNDETCEESNVMGNANPNPKENNVQSQTATIIQFRFDAREVRTLLIEDDPWFVAVDVCKALGITNTTQAISALDEDERSMLNIGRQGSANIISESGLFTLILRSREATTPGTLQHRFRKWVTAEVLPAIRRTGQYHDSSNKMATLVDALIGMSEVSVLKGLIRDKAKVVSIDKRRSFQQTMHNRLHTRFNVPRVELIPAQQFEAACNFVAAYALEGEWLPKSAGKSSAVPRPILKGQRWMVFVDDDGVERATEIPSDASVLSFDQFLTSMLIDCDMPVSTDEMFRFASLAMNNLQRRSQVCNAQLRAARSR